MNTIINTPPSTTEDNSAVGIVLGILITILVILFFIYGLPYIRNSSQPDEPNNTFIEVNVPNPTTNGTNNNPQNP